MCADEAGEVNGVYSEIGYIRGTIAGSDLIGQWFQTGLNVADLNGRCCTPNRGTFTFSFLTNSFSGSYLFEDINRGGESWTGSKKTSISPLYSQCWAPIETLTTSIQGKWDSDFTNSWDNCIDADGQWTSSYEYGSARTRGYITGRCFYNGQFCHGDWFEPGRVNGGYMVRLVADNQMAGSWWQFNASDFTSATYTLYSTNTQYHGGEIRNRVGGATGCSRNADLFFIGSSTITPPTQSDLPAASIIAIVVCIVGAALIAGIVLLCIYCRGCRPGGGGGGGAATFTSSNHRHHTTTRRNGFGRTHRRFGGGYS